MHPRHIEGERFHELMNTQCHKIDVAEYFQMLEYLSSAMAVVASDIVKTFPNDAVELMQLDDGDLVHIDRFHNRVYDALATVKGKS